MDSNLISRESIAFSLSNLKSELSKLESNFDQILGGLTLKTQFTNPVFKDCLMAIITLRQKIEALNMQLQNAVEGDSGGKFGSFIKKAFEEDPCSTFLFLKALCEANQAFAQGFLGELGIGKGMVENIPVKYRPILAIFLISHQGFRAPNADLEAICGDLIIDSESIIKILHLLQNFDEKFLLTLCEKSETDTRIKILGMLLASFQSIYMPSDTWPHIDKISTDKNFIFYVNLLESFYCIQMIQ